MAFGAFAPMPLRLGGATDEGWSPEQHARTAADLLAAKFVAPFAWMTFTKSGATVTIHDYYGQNGAGLASAPTATVIGTGVTAFDWTSGFVDAYGVPYALKVRKARVTPHGTSELFGTYALNYSSHAFAIFTWDSTDTAADCKATVRIW